MNGLISWNQQAHCSSETQARQGKIDLEKLKHAVGENPGAYLRELAAQFDVSTTAIHNRFEKHNITYKKKTFTYSEKNEKDRAEHIGKLENIPIEKRVYVDECGINQCLVRERGRALRGVKIEDTKRGRKFDRTNVISARTKDSSGKIRHYATFCYKNNTDSEFFESWFKKSLVKSIERGSAIMVDRASFHRKTKLKNLARRHGMKILFIPAYSPDLNPIEKDWANMKAKLIDTLPEYNDFASAVYDYFNCCYFLN